jgi:SAM-dependent methyltransferase
VAGYALLVSPGANRVYAGAAPALARAELALCWERVVGGALTGLRTETLGSVEYLAFEAGEELGPLALAVLSNLSATFALFAREGGALRPLELARLDRLDADLLTIPRYAGKTNEAFTRLLLNVTVASTAFAGELGARAFRVLDPLCGRGTTLDVALTVGFDAAGVELDRRDFEAYAAFIQRWVKDKRLPHRAQLGKVKGHPRLALDLALDRAGLKEGRVQRLAVVNASTLELPALFPPRSFDVVVADAPYGVQHGSTDARGHLSRSPLELVAEAAPAWREALRPGGAVGLAWNVHVAPRGKVLAALAAAGLEPCDGPAYRAFEHRVDRSILRDVVVARRAAG